VFAELEKILSGTAILATNTSSISVTSIGAALRRPEQLVGMHFFNPAPVMKRVEVVAGVATRRDVTETVCDTATAWGKVAVHTKSTPGFIVNRVARAFYAEPMRLLEEGVACPETFDGLFRKGGGFRMGPFELMDLIGNDVNFTVSQSVFEAFFYEARFRPSLLQQELVNAGHLGRKSGKGWYDYSSSVERIEEATDARAASPWRTLALDGEEERDGVIIVLTDGRRAAKRAAETGKPVILHDLVAVKSPGAHVGFATSPEVSEVQKQAFVASLSAQRFKAVHLPDWPGLVVLRTLALIANEGFEAVLQGVGTEEGVDRAMLYGVNYPKGPIAWAREIGLQHIHSVLSNLQAMTGDLRYRPSLRLKLLTEG
jgi:3-hydroxybutyryl-CoA dehydrogenase